MSARSLVVATATSLALGLTASTAIAAPGFGSLEQSGIRPGSQTQTQGAGQCTSNFVFTDSAGKVYLGQAAHCSGTGTSSDTNGCESGSLPLGTKVAVEGARQPGTLVYNSWLQMQKDGETDQAACQFNDLALIELDPADHDNVNPTLPVIGGPAAITSDLSAGATVFSYGNSSLRGGIDLLKPKRGFHLGTEGNGWSHTVLTLTPGIPGDSGSAFVDYDGHAFGVLSTLNILPLLGTNGVSDLSRMLSYAKNHAGLDVQVATSTGPARVGP